MALKINTGTKSTTPKYATPSTYAWNPSMGAPSNYDQWSSYHQQSGSYITDDAKRQAAYRAYATSRGLPTPWITSPATNAPVQPGITDPLDAQGTSELGNARQSWTNAVGGNGLPGTIQQNRDTQMANIAAERFANDMAWRDADRGVNRNASSRGMYNSGLRKFAIDRNLANLRNAMGLLDVRGANAQNDYLRDTGTANQQWSQAQTNIPQQSLDRKLEIWYALKGA